MGINFVVCCFTIFVDSGYTSPSTVDLVLANAHTADNEQLSPN